MTNINVRIVSILAVAAGFIPLQARAASQADLRVSVYSSGFVVDTERRVVYGDKARRVAVKSVGKGSAKGETPDTYIEIDRLDQRVQWQLDPKSKTYSESRYEASTPKAETPASSGNSPTLKITQIVPEVRGPLGSATINGLPCQSYTIRIIAQFADPSGKLVATETLLEKLWVTEKAPAIERFRKEEGNFREAANAVQRPERADFRWLLREFNRHVLEINDNMDDFRSLQSTYQGARASIKGVTVRQLAGWNWRPEAGPDEMQFGEDMAAFIGSIAAGLGAPPDGEGKAAMPDSEKPRWVQELDKDLGRTGPTAMFMEEILRARTAKVSSEYFDVPLEYRKQSAQ